MKLPTLCLLAAAAGLASPSCVCPACPIDSRDGVGVAFLSQPTTAEMGALASVLQLIAERAGPESDEVRALDAALGRRGIVIARFLPSPRGEPVRGYALLADGRVVVEDRYARAAAPDSGFLADPRVWPRVPFLYAAGHRLARGGTWRESIDAAAAFAGELADDLERGGVGESLPPGTDGKALAGALRAWRRGI